MMGQFSVSLNDFAAKVNQRADDFVGLVTIKIAKRLDERSPVGDATYWKNPPPKGYVGGRFRGNWQLGIDTVPEGETGNIDPTGTSTVNAIVAGVGPHPAGHVMYLSNNVPYAQRIEDGWSRQAPTGLVGLTAAEFQTFVDQALGELQ